MKCIIAGTRTFKNYNLIEESIIKSKFNISEIVSGNALGIDTLAINYAKNNCLKYDLVVFYPNWKRYGLKAGYIRNKKMGDYADALIAIWDGNSKGTNNMINYMKKLNKSIYILNIGVNNEN